MTIQTSDFEAADPAGLPADQTAPLVEDPAPAGDGPDGADAFAARVIEDSGLILRTIESLLASFSSHAAAYVDEARGHAAAARDVLAGLAEDRAVVEAAAERIEALEKLPRVTGLRVVGDQLFVDLSDGSSLQVSLPAAEGGVPQPQPLAPTFATLPSLTGSTELGGTVTVGFGDVEGVPAPTVTGTLVWPERPPESVADGATFTITPQDLGKSVQLLVTASSPAGSATRTVDLLVPAVAPAQVSDLKVEVAGTAAALFWAEPASGGAPISGYVVILDGEEIPGVDGADPRIVLNDLSAGPHSVTVAAVNQVGRGDASAVVAFEIADLDAGTAWVYAIDEGAGPTTSAESGTDAEIVGAAWHADPARLSFDGIASHMVVPVPAARMAGDFVCGAIVRFDDVTGTRQIMSMAQGSSTNKVFQLRVHDGSLSFVSFHGSAGSAHSDPAVVVPRDTWVMTTVHVTDTSATLRLNGEDIGTFDFASPRNKPDADTPLIVGARAHPEGRMADFLVGDIASLGITFDAVGTDIADLEARLMSVAEDKGVVPGAPPAPAQAAPVVVEAPTITGTAGEGQTLAATYGTAEGSPAPVPAGQWYWGDQAIEGATGLSRVLTAEDMQAADLRFVVVWTNGVGEPAEAASVPFAMPEPDLEPQPDTDPEPEPEPQPEIEPSPGPTEGRIATLTENYGGRKAVTPSSYFELGSNELDNPDSHPHIMGYTHVSVKDGNWSDPTVWDTGTVPGTGAVVRVYGGHTVTYDQKSDVILKDLLVDFGATLKIATIMRTRMRVDTIMVMGTFDYRDPTDSGEPGKPKHEIVFHPQVAPGATTRLGIMWMGPTRIHGARKEGHLRAAWLSGQTTPSIPQGATTITLPDLASSGWKVGDTVVVLGTNYVPTVTSDPQYRGPTSYWWEGDEKVTLNEYQFGEDEQRTITAINGDVVTLNSALTYDHTGMAGTLHDGKAVTVAPVVANVSRSIRFRSASAEEDGHLDPNADITDLQKRAHSMFMYVDDGDARYFETKNMARTSTDPSLWVVEGGALKGADSYPLASQGGARLAAPNNVRGRYSIHLHWCGGPYRSAPQFNVIGATAWAPVGDEPIPGWAITHHSTRAAIEDCVVSNVRGGGMVSEVGNEIGQWVGNVVTGCRGDGEQFKWGNRPERVSNHNDSGGVAYGNQSRAVLLHNNIAGSSKAAYFWQHQKTEKWLRSPRATDLRMADGLSAGSANHAQHYLDEDYGAINVQIPPFKHNQAFACTSGFLVIHRMNDNTINGHDKTPMLIQDFHCVNVKEPWTVDQYSNAYYSRDCMFQGPIELAESGGAVGLGSVTWDWSFSNCLIRNFNLAFKDNGAGLNYEGFLIDIKTENVNTFANAPYRKATGINSHPIRNVMGDWEPHPTDATQAIIRRWKSIPSSSLPQPYPLEPYGRKLPAGHPAVAIGDTPYFVLGDGTNGANSSGLSLTLKAGAGENSGSVHGIIRDSVGDRRWPDYQSSETFPSNTTIKGPRNLGRQKPEQLVQRYGCWNDNGTWKCRAWFFGADRFTHVMFNFHIDYTLEGFEPAFLAKHDLGATPVAPEWPDKLETVPSTQQDLTALVKPVRFLSRTYAEAVEGKKLAHRLIVDRIGKQFSIVGGADADKFTISKQTLRWAADGTRSRATAGDANGDHTYEVIVRATDFWGNSEDQAHQIVLVPSARVSDAIVDSFDRANGNLIGSAYARLSGADNTFTISSNSLAIANSTDTVVDMGSLGTSEQEITVKFRGSSAALVLMRMADANNWLGFRRVDGSTNALQVIMCVGGTQTELARYNNHGQSPVTVRVEGNRLVAMRAPGATYHPMIMYPKNQTTMQVSILDQDPLTEPGAVLLPANAPKGHKVGLKSSGSTSSAWLDDFSAKAVKPWTPPHPRMDDPVAPPLPPVNPTPEGYKAIQDFTIDKALTYNWGSSTIDFFLPSWVGGDQGNGLGGSYGDPSKLDYNSDKSITVNAAMDPADGKWKTGWMQSASRINKTKGKWGAIVSATEAHAVHAFFVFASNAKELDFELTKKNGVIGWSPAVHMPKTGGGAAHSNKRVMNHGTFKPGVQQRLEVELFDDRAEFRIDGVLFETITPADMSDGSIWDVSTKAGVFLTNERHASWAGWTASDYAQGSAMTVHSLLM
ncbi:fibronectin type III domain-containing protein [uncultured Paracoccus sp.]|uniref:fibronectin type III domain-containing protein n=1 Tax=uncultured Paracoccus sp. TaxID=189685 RepID=UPI0026215EF9|nr:fibronectin type III domain-containing protein [uncultured Paracoccus sp.]